MSSIDFDPTKLKAIRKRLDLTQAAFANAAGVSQSLVAKIEAGRIDPTFSNAKKIAEAVDALSMKKEARAGEIMTRDVVFAKPSEMVIDIAHVMGKKNISQLPVMDSHKVVGMVSEASILEARLKRPVSDLKVRDVMAEPPPSVSISSPISAVIGLLRYFPAVLVIKDGSIEGIITKSDVIRSSVK